MQPLAARMTINSCVLLYYTLIFDGHLNQMQMSPLSVAPRKLAVSLYNVCQSCAKDLGDKVALHLAFNWPVISHF